MYVASQSGGSVGCADCLVGPAGTAPGPRPLLLAGFALVWALRRR